MRKKLTALVVGTLTMALAACGSTTDTSDNRTLANMGTTIGIAMPSRQQTRWISDGNNMVTQFEQMGYKTDLRFAEDNAKTQAQQIQSMVDDGDKLLVVAAVDGSALTDVLESAGEKKVPVIAYERLIMGTPNVDYLATFDNNRVGILQANMLVEKLGLPAAKGPFTLEMIAGSPGDSNAKVYYVGAMHVLRPYLDSGQIVVRSDETQFSQMVTENWEPEKAAARMDKIVSRYYGKRKLDAVLSPSDGISLAVVKGLEKRGYGSAAKPLPFISGQDAEVNSIKSIVAGKQTGTVFKDTRELAKVAVQMGNAMLTGGKPTVNDTVTYNNGSKVVPSYLLEPLSINKQNYRTLLVEGGYYTSAQLN